MFKNDYYLSQEITKPTHKKGNTLDLLFTNNSEMLHSYESNPTIFSDHYLVEGKINYCSDYIEMKDRTIQNAKEKKNKETLTANFNQLNFFSEKINWKVINKELQSFNWRLEFRGLSPEEMLDTFFYNCFSVCEKYIPQKKMHSKSVTNEIPRDRKNLMRNRKRRLNAISRVCSSARRDKLLAEVRMIEKKLKISYDNDLAESEHKAIVAISKNSKYFYSYAKKFSKIKSSIGPFLDSANNLVSCPAKMAEILKSQYEAVFSNPLEPMVPATDIFDSNDYFESPTLSNISFGPEDIEKAIDELSPNSAAGPDQFPSVLLKQSKGVLSAPLYLIWKKSLTTGIIPDILKKANIVPIHKGGSRGEPKNYRPVALTSHIIKVFEKVLRNHIVAHLEENNLLNPG